MTGPASGRPLLAANWKMNPTTALEAAGLAREVTGAAEQHAAKVTVALFPPFPWLLEVAGAVGGTSLQLGAQDCYWESSGAYTGAVSADMLAGLCTFVLAGHSERRKHFGETDADVARKVKAALHAGLHVIACVGELDEHYEAGHTEPVVSDQVRAALAGVAAPDAKRLVIAYEPVWAIGTGKNADPAHADRTMRVIRRVAGESIGQPAADGLRVLYGGSVNAANVAGYVELPSCDGCLVGGASLKAAEFSSMIGTVAHLDGTSAGNP